MYVYVYTYIYMHTYIYTHQVTSQDPEDRHVQQLDKISAKHTDCVYNVFPVLK